MKKVLFILGIFVMCGLVACGGNNSGSSSATDENRTGVAEIKAETGGTVEFNNELILSVPSNSLSSNTTISIEHTTDVPQNFEEDFQPIGQAYSCKPGGTEFALNKPAVMELYYNEEALLAKGLDPRTLTLFYYNEEEKCYIAVENRVDLDAKKIIAHIEHFTIYLPLAKAMLATNNAPTITRQASIPGTIRTGAPIFVRATIRDNDADGSIVSPKVYYRKRNPTIDSWQVLPMKRDLRPTGTATEFGTYVATIPAAYLNSSNLGTGSDIQYYFEAYDNLGARTQTATYSYNVTRTLNTGSITITPASLTIAAGFGTLFIVRGIDRSGTRFSFVPDSFSVSNALGTLKNYGSQGICFLSQKKGSGELTVTAGADFMTAPIIVKNGDLTYIQILNTNGTPFSGPLMLNYNSTYDFDVLGYDEFGNTTLVNPVWSCDAELGSINQNGHLTTAMAAATGNVTVTLGDLTATQQVTVMSATKDILSFSLNGWSGTISAPFINVPISETADITHLVTTYTTNGTRVLVGGVEQQSGATINDFTNPVVYTVFAEDGTSRDYTVSLTLLNSAKAITSYSINGSNGLINGSNIIVNLPIGTDLTSLVATFTTTATSISVGSVVQQSGLTANDFTNPITYSVTAADGSTADYVVKINLEITILTSNIIFDFESGMPSGYFADPSQSISASIITVDTHTQFGSDSNNVLSLNITNPRAWAGLHGFNLTQAQNWSSFEGVCFWFKGLNTRKNLLFAVFQTTGEWYQAVFCDNSYEWKMVYLPWSSFTYREGGVQTKFTQTAITTYFIQFSDIGLDTSFEGTIYIDQLAAVTVSD
jgi:hypothetical protein